MGLEDYISKPVPDAVLNDPAIYADLQNELRQAFADNANLLTIAANIVQLANTVVSKFSGVSPMVMVQALSSGNYTQLESQLAALHGTTVAGATVTDPTTGSTCPLTTAFNSIVAGLGSNGLASVQGIVAKVLKL